MTVYERLLKVQDKEYRDFQIKLVPGITKEQMTEIENAVASLGDVENSSVQMVTATMRVYADVPDDWGVDAVRAKADEIYSTVTSILDPAVYFTQTDGRKMYDIEIHVYNLAADRESDAFVYVIENKTSSMGSPIASVVSEPLDAELAQRLRDDVEARKAAEEEARLAEEAEAAAAAEAEAAGEGEGEAEGAENAEEVPEENTEG